MATVTAAREFTSSNLHAFRVIGDAPVEMAADGTIKSYSILGVEHRTATTSLIGWYRTSTGWIDEVLETWAESITDAQALSTSEYLPTPFTISR